MDKADGDASSIEVNRKSAPLGKVLMMHSNDGIQTHCLQLSNYENGYNLSKEKIEGVDVVSIIIERVLCATFCTI